MLLKGFTVKIASGFATHKCHNHFIISSILKKFERIWTNPFYNLIKYSKFSFKIQIPSSKKQNVL